MTTDGAAKYLSCDLVHCAIHCVLPTQSSLRCDNMTEGLRDVGSRCSSCLPVLHTLSCLLCTIHDRLIFYCFLHNGIRKVLYSFSKDLIRAGFTLTENNCFAVAIANSLRTRRLDQQTANIFASLHSNLIRIFTR